jgi:hypothetical protein
MGEPFVLFSLVLLPCLYFIGLVTFVREVPVAIEDMVHARGMARIRHYYAEIPPIIRRHLVHSIHDDPSALLVERGLTVSPWQFFMSTAGMVSAINGAIAGVFVGVMATALLGPMTLGVTTGLPAFAASILLHGRHHARAWNRAEQRLPPRFPESSDERWESLGNRRLD